MFWRDSWRVVNKPCALPSLLPTHSVPTTLIWRRLQIHRERGHDDIEHRSPKFQSNGGLWLGDLRLCGRAHRQNAAAIVVVDTPLAFIIELCSQYYACTVMNDPADASSNVQLAAFWRVSWVRYGETKSSCGVETVMISHRSHVCSQKIRFGIAVRLKSKPR